MPKKPVNYGYTIQPDVDPTLYDQSGEKFDDNGRAELITANQPDRKAMRYMGKGDDINFNTSGAGAGRGKRGGPTAKELEGKKSGGAIKAKGWGKARGARKAKIY